MWPAMNSSSSNNNSNSNPNYNMRAAPNQQQIASSPILPPFQTKTRLRTVSAWTKFPLSNRSSAEATERSSAEDLLASSRQARKIARHKEQQRLLQKVTRTNAVHLANTPLFRPAKRTCSIGAEEHIKEHFKKTTNRLNNNRQLLRRTFAKKALESGGARKLFNFLDKDRRGEICLTQFKRGLEKLGLAVILADREETQRLFDLIDENSDGWLDYHEILAFLGRMADGNNVKRRGSTSFVTAPILSRCPKTGLDGNWAARRAQKTEQKLREHRMTISTELSQHPLPKPSFAPHYWGNQGGVVSVLGPS